MTLSPLRLNGCYFTKVNLNTQPDAKNEDLARYQLKVESDVTCPDPGKPRNWLVCLNVQIIAQKDIVAPYCGELEVVGDFSIAESWPPELLEKLAWINGSGILFGSIREMVCAITARGFFDMLVLPCWSFAEMYKDLEQKRKGEAEMQTPLKLEPAAAMAVASVSVSVPLLPLKK